MFIKDRFALESNYKYHTINKLNISNKFEHLIKSNTKMKHCKMMLEITISTQSWNFKGGYIGSRNTSF